MSKINIIIAASPGEVRGALVRGGSVSDVVHHRTAEPSLIGAVYRGRVRRIDAGLNGAFVDIGLGGEAYLRARDASEPGGKVRRNTRISERIHEGAQIDVRVVADGFADKGPRIARIHPDPAHDGKPVPTCLQAPPSPVALILERFTPGGIDQVICGDAGIENAVRDWSVKNQPGLADRVMRQTGDVFAEHAVDDAIAAALARRVRVPGGAELVFDTTEAMCVIDINSGQAPGRSGRASRDVNLKVMPEIARQLRLRNIAGAIVIDALKMGARDDRNRVLSSLRDALKGDPGACHVLGITNLGLVEMTRTRTGLSLADRMLEPAAEPAPSAAAVAYDALRAVLRAAAATPSGGYRLMVAPAVADALNGPLAAARDEARDAVGRLEIAADPSRTPDRFEVVLGSAGSARKAS